MTTMTLRGIDEKIAAILKERARREATSVNALTLRLLRNALGLEKPKRVSVHHDLDHLAGTWSEEDAREFTRAVEGLGEVDQGLWQDVDQN